VNDANSTPPVGTAGIDPDAGAEAMPTVAAPPFRGLVNTPKVAWPGLECAGANGTEFPVVAGYEIVAELGRGGMGVVYLARQCSLKRSVALKMIRADAYADPTARTRFRIEAEAVARLSHPNVVQIHEVGEFDGKPFLAMEYIAGGSLEKSAGAAPLPAREVARLVETLARAVHHTHQNSILHRDLKPSNILLTTDGIPKITDFGLAKFLDADSGATKTEMLLGTPNYMSPEQAAGNTKEIGPLTDVYSLGAVLYELLTTEPPFMGTGVLDTLEQVRTREPTPPRRLDGNISRDLETICLKCLEKEPTNRYSSAEALADELHRFLTGEPVHARPLPAWHHAWRTIRRRPWRFAGATGSIALLCVVLTCWWYTSVAGQLAHDRAEENHHKFLQRRNDALFYGLLADDEGALFLGFPATANRQKAESAAREALALAGLDVQTPAPAVASFPGVPDRELAEDCYMLLLVLANVKGRQASAGGKDQGHYDEPLRLLDAAGKLGIRTSTYHTRRADLLNKAGKPEEARAARADIVIEESPLDNFLVGEEQYRRGKFAEAGASFDRVLARQPGHFWAQFLQAICQLKSQQWATAKTGFNACLSQQPEFVWGYLFRSFAHEKLQEWANAEADFSNAQRLDPKEDARYVLYLTRGIFYFNQRELDRSAADFHAAIALKPDQYNGYLNLAHVYLAQQKVEQAAAQIDAAMRLNPPSQVVFGYHVERGRNLLHDKRYEEALAACDVARQLRGDQLDPFAISGRALLELGRFREAELSFDQYLKRGGESLPDVFRARGHTRMKLGKYPEAAEDYGRALEQAPDADVYHHRGWAYFFADAWKLALRDFARAIDLNPDLGDAYTGRGLAHVMLGQYRDAVADAKEAARRKPGTPEMMHNVACIYAQAVAQAETDLAAKDRRAQVAEYRRCAMDAVRRTLYMVPLEERSVFWREKIRTDSALAPIRQDAGFQRLENSDGIE
jgi:eukaryotic-like serine/threonine-protein kinase